MSLVKAIGTPEGRQLWMVLQSTSRRWRRWRGDGLPWRTSSGMYHFILPTTFSVVSTPFQSGFEVDSDLRSCQSFVQHQSLSWTGKVPASLLIAALVSNFRKISELSELHMVYCFLVCHPHLIPGNRPEPSCFQMFIQSLSMCFMVVNHYYRSHSPVVFN